MKKVLKSPFLWGVLAALIVVVPQIKHYQFLSTDSIHAAVLEGVAEHPGLGPFSLYQFSDGTPQHNAALASNGNWPWFLNTNWKINFCRHLPSALTALNHKISGLNPAGYAVHSLLWYLALILLLAQLARRLVPLPEGKGSHPVTYLTVVVFAFAISHSQAVFYGAARWIIMAAAFGLAGLLAHMKWREQGWKPGRFLSMAAFIAALLCGEAALAVLAYLAAYELFGRADPFKKRIAALLPAAVLVVIYLVIYRIAGYGTAGMAVYTNPFNDPLAYLVALPTKIAALLGEMFFKTISLFGINPLEPAQRLLILAVGAAALVLIGLLFSPVWSASSPDRRRTFTWIAAGTLASIPPIASAPIGGRVVLIPFIGGALLLAFILHYWWQRLRKNLKSPKAWVGGLLCVGLFFINLLYSPYSWFSGARDLKAYVDMYAASQKDTVLNDIQPYQEAVFLNNSPDISYFNETYYYRRIKRLPMPRAWWQLSFSSQKHRYLRTAADTLELEITTRSFPESYDYYGLYYSGSVLKKGNIIRLTGLQITILAVDWNGQLRVEFKFDRPLENERYRFYKFQDNKLHQVNIPEIGQSMEL